MEEVDLKQLFEMFWNRKKQVFLIVLVFIIIGLIYTIFLTVPKYTSSTTLVLTGSENSGGTSSNTITTTDVTLNSKLVSTYSEIVKSNNVIRQVISNLGLDISEDELRNSVSVSSVEDTEMIKITVTTKNAEDSAKIANETANVFSAKVAEMYNINNVHILDQAEIDNNPSNINHPKDIVIFTFIGIVIAVIYVLLANMLDTTVKTAEDLERELKIPVLASIPIYENALLKRKGGRR